MNLPNEFQLKTYIDMTEHSISLLRKLNDPMVNNVIRYLTDDLNTLKRNCGIPVNLTDPTTQSQIEKESYGKV